MGVRRLTVVEGVLAVVILFVVSVAVVPLLRGPGAMRRSNLPRAQCSGNLSALGKALAIYASMNDDRFPATTMPSGASWLCDLPRDTARLLEETIHASNSSTPPQRRRVFYCPVNKAQDAVSLWNEKGTYAVTGYTWFTERPGVTPGREGGEGLYGRMLGGAMQPGRVDLVTDWIVSKEAPGSGRFTWSGLTVPGRPGVYGSSHIERRGPQGSNVLALDGHVEWRPFAARTARAYRQGSAPDALWFWVPAY